MLRRYSLMLGLTAAAALPKMNRYIRPPRRTRIGLTGAFGGWITIVVGVKPMSVSIRTGMYELKNVSSTFFAEAPAGRPRRTTAGSMTTRRRMTGFDRRRSRRATRVRPGLAVRPWAERSTHDR